MARVLDPVEITGSRSDSQIIYTEKAQPHQLKQTKPKTANKQKPTQKAVPKPSTFTTVGRGGGRPRNSPPLHTARCGLFPSSQLQGHFIRMGLSLAGPPVYLRWITHPIFLSKLKNWIKPSTVSYESAEDNGHESWKRSYRIKRNEQSPK